MMAVLSWLIFSGQQAVVIGVFGALARAIPTSTTLWPVRLGGRWHWPTFITVPLLWFLVVNKIGNGSWILGIPWSMLEYSQYKQLPLLSLCPYIGGIGLEVILVGVNVLFACAVVSYFNWSGRPRVSYRARPGMIFSMATTASILALALAVTTGKGAISGSQDSCETSPAKAPAKTITVSVIQGNVGLDPVSPRKIVSDQVKLTSTAPKGLCVWTEWSVPCYLSSRPDVYQKLACEAKKNEQDWLVGTMDKSTTGEVYNAVCALSKAGDVIKPAYYKRFLVPFGEYIPDFFKNSPLNALLSGSDDENFQPGKEATIINLQQVKVAPLVCFESIKPELVTESVRAGGEIIADLSDIKWFGTCILRDQLLAACVMRAAECNRSFVFASNTGPSALIAPNGKIKRMGPADCAAVIVDQLPLQDRLTPFCRWYR
jgi:apolipoprotein N-acyltransferase